MQHRRRCWFRLFAGEICGLLHACMILYGSWINEPNIRDGRCTLLKRSSTPCVVWGMSGHDYGWSYILIHYTFFIWTSLVFPFFAFLSQIFELVCLWEWKRNLIRIGSYWLFGRKLLFCSYHDYIFIEEGVRGCCVLIGAMCMVSHHGQFPNMNFSTTQDEMKGLWIFIDERNVYLGQIRQFVSIETWLRKDKIEVLSFLCSSGWVMLWPLLVNGHYIAMLTGPLPTLGMSISSAINSSSMLGRGGETFTWMSSFT